MSSQDKSNSESLVLMKSVQNNPQLLEMMESSVQNDLEGVNLEFKDYIALTIALLETVFFPISILLGTLVALALLFQFL
jgi:hypothetical protein